MRSVGKAILINRVQTLGLLENQRYFFRNLKRNTRRRRTDRQEIGWYGFAAQRGCTHIIASALPLIGLHYLGQRTVLIPSPRVNSAILRSRGASSMLEHPAVLFRTGQTRGHISVSGTAGPRVRIQLSQAASQV